MRSLLLAGGDHPREPGEQPNSELLGTIPAQGEQKYPGYEDPGKRAPGDPSIASAAQTYVTFALATPSTRTTTRSAR